MSLELRNKVSRDYNPQTWQEIVGQLQTQINLLSNGVLAATYNANTAAPTTGTYAQGDFVKNSTPSELGTAGSKYVILGWVCTVGGSPGTFVETRCLTGN